LILTFSLVYIFSICLILYGISRRKPTISNLAGNPFISVIIAARDEESMIGGCLEAFSNQTYPDTDFEIIVVDDRSDDQTGEIVEKHLHNHPHWQLVRIRRIPDGWAPKKHALSRGIQSTRPDTDIIALTDADCVPSSGWLTEISRAFDENTGMVIGASPSYPGSYRPGEEMPGSVPIRLKKKLLALFSYIETLALGAIASGSANLGYPLTCTGRNIAIRRNVLEEVGIYQEIKHYISGDDDLLLSRVRDRTAWKVKSLYSPEATVWTYPPSNTRSLIQARLRHTSKIFDYHLRTISILTLLYLWHLIPFCSLVLGAVSFTPNSTILVFLPVKTAADLLLLTSYAATRRLPMKHLIFLPVMELISLFYVCIIPPLSLVTGFSWKGTRYRSKAVKGKTSSLNAPREI